MMLAHLSTVIPFTLFMSHMFVARQKIVQKDKIKNCTQEGKK